MPSSFPQPARPIRTRPERPGEGQARWLVARERRRAKGFARGRYALYAAVATAVASNLLVTTNPRAEKLSESSEVRPQVEPLDASSSDGVYGRFHGDLDLGLGLGMESLSDTTLAHAELSLLYFSLSGLRLGYSDALAEADTERNLSVRLEIKPLFIPRWQANWERGPGYLDLILDSFSLGLGAFWAQPLAEDFGDGRGLEGALGLGVPALPNAEGLWLEAMLIRRWPDDGDASTAFSVTLSWHSLFSSGLH